MDKEDFYELMVRFIKHTKEYSNETYEWIIEDMENNGLFEVYSNNLKEEFKEMI